MVRSPPAYQRIRQDRGLGQQLLEALLRCVFTREIRRRVAEDGLNGGVSRSSVSHHAVWASADQLKTLWEQPYPNVRSNREVIFRVHGVFAAVFHDLTASARLVLGAGREGKGDSPLCGRSRHAVPLKAPRKGLCRAVPRLRVTVKGDKTCVVLNGCSLSCVRGDDGCFPALPS
jgi:hypothetical protein